MDLSNRSVISDLSSTITGFGMNLGDYFFIIYNGPLEFLEAKASRNLE